MIRRTLSTLALDAVAAQRQGRNPAAANGATQQHKATVQQGQATFAQARVACLEGKRYTVK
jgi:hypothetical protein